MASFYSPIPPQGRPVGRAFLISQRPPRIQVDPPQDVSGGLTPPPEDNELIEETASVFDHLLFDDGTDTGFVLIEE